MMQWVAPASYSIRVATSPDPSITVHSAHGHRQTLLSPAMSLKQKFKIESVAGNIATA